MLGNFFIFIYVTTGLELADTTKKLRSSIYSMKTSSTCSVPIKKANTSLGIPRKETETKQKMLVMSLPWCHLSLWPPLCFTECFCCRAQASEVVVWGNTTGCWHCFGNSSLKGRIPGIVDFGLIQSFSCFCILITRFHWKEIFFKLHQFNG